MNDKEGTVQALESGAPDERPQSTVRADHRLQDPAAMGRYLALCGVVLALLWAHSWTDAWRGDFWIYVATVNEVAASPSHHVNPLFGNDYPFAFLSPYTVALGIASRLLSIGPFEVLVLQGVFNLFLLLTAVYAFTATWVRRPAASFYALLFILFLWGRDPWLFSSVFHLRSLAFVMPYPSTFAAALALLGLAAFPLAVRSLNPATIALGVGLAATLWIIHPVNALFLFLGLFAWSLSFPRPVAAWAWLALALSGSLALAISWPLFPVGDLWTQQVQQVHEGNALMYDAPLPRIAPALLGIPCLLLRLRRNPRDPLALLALALGAAVVYGGLFGRWSYGRLLSHAVLLCQVALADAVAALEERIRTVHLSANRRHLLPLAATLLLAAASWSSALRPTLAEAGRGDPRWLGFLRREVGHDDVVLTNLENCWHVPAFAGKVVAYPMPLPFVPDHEQRKSAVERFFRRGTSLLERRATLERYGVSYVLAPRTGLQPEQATPDELRRFGTVVYSSADYELLRIRSETARFP